MGMRMSSAEIARIVRFFCVACAATGTDALVALLGLHCLGLPLIVCVVAGFVCGFVLAYVLHHGWTFGASTASSSHARSFPRFAASNLLLLGMRIAFVWLGTQALLLMGVAIGKWVESALYVGMLGFSFVCNYILCRVWVFKPRQ